MPVRKGATWVRSLGQATLEERFQNYMDFYNNFTPAETREVCYSLMTFSISLDNNTLASSLLLQEEMEVLRA